MISVLFLHYFIQNTNGVDFCQLFTKNGFAIDYGFGGNISPGFPHSGFLIIDQTYWKIDVDIFYERIRFVSTHGIENTGYDGFGYEGKRYKTAFGYWSDVIGLINVSIEWTLDQIYWQSSHRKRIISNSENFRTDSSHIPECHEPIQSSSEMGATPPSHTLRTSKDVHWIWL